MSTFVDIESDAPVVLSRWTNVESESDDCGVAELPHEENDTIVANKIAINVKFFIFLFVFKLVLPTGFEPVLQP